MASVQFPAFYLRHASSQELSKQQFWHHASGISSDIATCKLRPILRTGQLFCEYSDQ